MRIELELNKSIEQNAAVYFEKAKKARRKAQTIAAVLEAQKARLRELEAKLERQEFELARLEEPRAARPRAWYEVYRWFLSSDGFIVIGGRDATQNEIIIKKRAERDDIVLHAEQPGSPFVLIKVAGRKSKEVPDSTIAEAAAFCASYSKAWKSGIVPDVYWVRPEQVTKEAKAGEYVPKGAFVIYGKRNYVRDIEVRIAIGLDQAGRVVAGPITAITKQAKHYIIVRQDGARKSTLAKMIATKLGIPDRIDEIMAVLPGDGLIV